MSGPTTTILLAPSKVTEIHANTTDGDAKFDTGVAVTPLPGNTLSYAMSTAYTDTNAPTDASDPNYPYDDDKRIYAFAETGVSKKVTMHIANLIEGTTYKMIVTDSTDATEEYTPKNRVNIITFKYVNNDIVLTTAGNSKFYVKTTDMSTDPYGYVTADRVTDTQYTEGIHTNIARIVVTGTNVYNGAKLQISISSPSTVTGDRTADGQSEADTAWCSLAFSTSVDTAAPLLVTGGPLAPLTQYLAGVAAPKYESSTDVQWIFDRIGFAATEYQEVAISKVHLTYTAVDTLSATEVPLDVDMLRVNPPDGDSYYVLIPAPKENEPHNDLTPVTVTTSLSPIIFDIPNGITSDGVAKEFEYAMAYEDENGYIGPYSGSESALKLSDKPGRVNGLKVTNPPPVSGTGNVTLVWRTDGYIADNTTLTKFKVYYKLGSENVTVEGTTTLTATEETRNATNVVTVYNDLKHELKAGSFSFDSGLYTAMIDATATTYSAPAGPDDKYFFWVVPVATDDSDDTIEFTGEPSFTFSLGYDYSSGITDDAAGYDTPGGLAVAAVPTAPIVQTAGTNVNPDGVTLFVGNDNSAIDASAMSQRIGITVASSVLIDSANGTDGADIGLYYRVFSGDVTGIDKDTELDASLGQTFTKLTRADDVFKINGSAAIDIYTSLSTKDVAQLVNGTNYIVQVAYGYPHADGTTLVISGLYTSGILTPSTIPAMSELYNTGTTDSITFNNPNGFITDDNHESTAEIKLDFDYSNPILFGGLSELTTLNVGVRRTNVESYRTRGAPVIKSTYTDKSLDYNADGEYTLTSTDFSNIAHGALYNIQLGVTSDNGDDDYRIRITTTTNIAKMSATYTGALTKVTSNDGSLPTSRDSNGDLAYHLEFNEVAATENTGGYAADYYRLVGVQEINGALVTVVDEIFANPIAAASRNQGGKVSLLSSGTTGTGTGTGIAVPIGVSDSVDRDNVLLGGSATSTPSDVIFSTLTGGGNNTWMKDGADGTSTTATVKIDTEVAEPGQAIHYAIIPYAAHTTIYPTATGNGLPGKPFVHPIKNDVDLRLASKGGDARIDGLANDTTITGQTGLKVSWKPAATNAVANATIKSFEVTLFKIADIDSGDISYIEGAYALANGKVRATRIGEIITVVASNQDIETVYNHTFDDLIVGTPYIVRISTVLEYGPAGNKDTKRTPGVFAGSSTGLYSASEYAESVPGSDDNLTYPVDFSTSTTKPKLWIPTSTPGVTLNRNEVNPGSATLVINNSGSTITHASMVQIYGPSGPPSGVTNDSNSFVYDLKTEAMADGKVTPVASGTVVSITGSDLNNAVYTYSMLEYTIGNTYLGTDWSREQNYIFVANGVGGVVHDGTEVPS